MWGVARAFGGRVVLRLEDHDRTRSRPEFETQILEDLEWLGCVADFRAPRQSERGPRYAEALGQLADAGLVYPCACSRKSIAEIVGSNEGEVRYPGTCRVLDIDGAIHQGRRILLASERVSFNDLRPGLVEPVPDDLPGQIPARQPQ